MPRVEEKHKSLTKGFISMLLEMGHENDQLVSLVAHTKVNVKMNATNEIGKQGRDVYFHVYVIAVVLALHIPISFISRT